MEKAEAISWVRLHKGFLRLHKGFLNPGGAGSGRGCGVRGMSI